MTKMVLDEALRARLKDLAECIELCDQSGRTLGYFVPAADQQRSLYGWAHGEFTDKEIERARREPGGLPIAEVLENLGD